MKKKIILFSLLLLPFVTTQAQFLRFGLKAGVTFSNFTGGEIENVDFNTITSFHGGAVMEMKILDHFSIQPEALYVTQGAELEGLDQQVKNELGYISIPVMAKFYLGGEKFNLQVGPQMSFLVNERNDVHLNDTNSFDFAVGGGLEYKFTEHVFIQGRYMAGLTKVSSDADIKNSAVHLSLGFMF